MVYADIYEKLQTSVARDKTKIQVDFNEQSCVLLAQAISETLNIETTSEDALRLLYNQTRFPHTDYENVSYDLINMLNKTEEQQQSFIENKITEAKKDVNQDDNLKQYKKMNDVNGCITTGSFFSGTVIAIVTGSWPPFIAGLVLCGIGCFIESKINSSKDKKIKEIKTAIEDQINSNLEPIIKQAQRSQIDAYKETISQFMTVDQKEDKVVFKHLEMSL